MWKNVLLALASTLLTLGILELAVRVSPHGHKLQRLHYSARSGLFRLDPDLVYALAPGATAVWRTRESTETARINGAGMRDDRELAPRAPGEIRILAVGDSFTYGSGVAGDEAFPSALERSLRARGLPVSVLNAGVPGYGTDQEYRYVRLRGAGLRPDLVLLGVQATDVRDNIDVPLYDLRDGQLVPLDARKTWIYLQGRLLRGAPGWLRHSDLFLWLVEKLRGHDPFGLRPRLEPALLADWSREKIRREVLDLQALGRERGFALVVVLMPAKEHIDPRSPSLYGDLSQRLGAEVPLLDGLAALRRAEPDVGALFFRYDIHLTPDGNRLLGDAVAAFLVERGLVGSGAALPVARRDAPVDRDHGAGDVRTRP